MSSMQEETMKRSIKKRVTVVQIMKPRAVVFRSSISYQSEALRRPGILRKTESANYPSPIKNGFVEPRYYVDRAGHFDIDRDTYL